MKYILIILFIILPAQSFSQNFRTFNVMSGTGFFVNRNYVVTNAHVVGACKNVIVKGAIPEHEGRVTAIDAERDLAVIQIDMPPPEVAPLRYNIDDLKAGDGLMIIGYPGEAGARGEYRVANTNIVDIKVEGDNGKWLYVTDVVQHGNSGGPVFDTSGNVIGVVVAKAQIKKSFGDPSKSDEIIPVGVVISLNTLKQFLLNNGVFSEAGGVSVNYSESYIEERARNYIVNVQCRIPE